MLQDAKEFAMTIKYRTKDSEADYEFSFERTPEGDLRAYIVSQPSYRNRATDANSTHRLSENGRKYVCWTQQIWNRSQLEWVVAEWCDRTQRYIKYGTPIL
jgi:hypothetical protein